MSCKISEIIQPQNIWMNLPTGLKSKTETLQVISQLLASKLKENEKTELNLNAEIIFEKLQERETKASTGADHGLAIPHACFEECSEAVLFLFRSSEGVMFQSMDGLPSQLFFVILAPEKRKAGELGHLQVLSAICRLMRHVGVREKLLMASSEADIISLLRTNE